MTKHILNLFPLEGFSKLECEYHLLEVIGLPNNRNLAELLNKLATTVAKSTQHPVTSYKRGEKYYLATTADPSIVTNQWRLTPHIATLVPTQGKERLNFKCILPEQVELALNLLRFQIRGALEKSQELWNDSPSTFYSRTPTLQYGEVDVFSGFHFHLHHLEDGNIYLSLDSTFKYVDRRSLLEHLTLGREFSDYKFQHFLYRSRNWFRIQLYELTGATIAEQMFIHKKDGKTYNVFDYTVNACGFPQPYYIKALSSDSPAILYRYPNDRQEFYGAAALCYKTYLNDAPQIRNIHRQSVLQPPDKLEVIQDLIRLQFHDIPFRTVGKFSVSNEPFTKKPQRFDIPGLLFGNGKVLRVQNNGGDGIPAQELGRKRMEYLQSRDGGLLVQDPLNNQYLIAPQSLHRTITTEYGKEHVRQIKTMYPKDYRLSPTVLYDDADARNLRRQVFAIKRAIEANRIDRGAALLILPENAHPGLHNYLKRELSGTLQTQCLMATSLLRFFARNGNGVILNEARRRDFISYARYAAIGMLLANRQWLFALADPLHYDIHVGIDVLNGRAGFTYLYNQGKDIFFRSYDCTGGEKLSQRLVQRVLYQDLRSDIERLNLKASSLVTHRDGRTFAEELDGNQAVINRLKMEGFLPAETRHGVVEIHKTSSSHLRIFLERQNQIENPEVGDWFALNRTEGIVCNTGWPFRIPGTVRPLLVSQAHGDLEIEKVLEDEFALSLLALTAPDKPSRIPIITRLGDMFLRPLASETNDEAALYEDEDFVSEISGAKVVNF